MAPAGMPSSAQPPRLARRLARAPPPAPHPPRRGLRRRPALRGALRLVGFAPEGMPAGATRPGIRVGGECCGSSGPACGWRGRGMSATAPARVRARRARSRVTLACG